MSDIKPQDGGGSPDNRRSPRGPGWMFGGLLLLTIGILLGIAFLPLALEDPSTSCAAGHDCIELVDMRPIGLTGVGIALLFALPGARMIWSATRPR